MNMIVLCFSCVHSRSTDGWTPLTSVAVSGSTEIAKLLVENQAEVNPQKPKNVQEENGALLVRNSSKPESQNKTKYYVSSLSSLLSLLYYYIYNDK